MNPTNAYVAGFVGQTNFITGTIEKDQPKGKLVVACSFGTVECTAPGLSNAYSSGEKVLVTIRPEEIVSYSEAPQDLPNTFPATVLRTIFIGNRTQCELQIGTERCQTEVEGRSSLASGAKITAQLPPDRIRILPSDNT
jgi:spermidine/putrescine transport system ATP-binding protein